ncbi:MAG: TonB-dependent receptor [Bacteroidales bacterium]|nr:TonB-dependent receptor [Bacteroidales bacterium]MBN2818583.1 TonB-dependent receptor [Bacteroidales bacterium]
MKYQLLTLTFLTSFLCSQVFAQKFTVSGYIKDNNNGESLIGANVLVKGTYTGTVSNAYGFYSLTLEKGNYDLVFNYTGFTDNVIPVNLNKDIVLNVDLKTAVEEIEEVVIMSTRKNNNIVSTEMSNVKLESATIKKIPVLMGETDIIKTLQLLPGIKSTGGLSAGMSVRGSTRDQNLLLLDEAIVYSAAHLGGIFSVFNNDAIKNVEIHKGFVPAEMGGRLASVLDIRMKDGNTKNFSANGGIGLISSRLTIEGPIVKDKCSFIVSGRRTYLDAAIGAAKKVTKNAKIQEFPIHFYDLNAKINYTINQNNRLYLSGYFGRDVFSFSANEDTQTKFNWGNYTTTLRWNHVYNNRLFSNVTLLASNYDYLMDTKYEIGRDKKEFAFKYGAFIKDYSAKIDFGYYLNQKNTIKFGAISTYHDINTGKVTGRQDTVNFSFKIPSIPGVENAAYISNEQKIGSKLSLNYGLRYSLFFNTDSNKINIVEDDYHIIGNKKYGWKNTIYQGFEPRFGATVVINDKQSIKSSYSRTYQYMSIASNSTTGNPLDVWILTTPNIKPQICDQVSAGYFRNFFDNAIETSVEVYYKKTQNQVAFKEFAQPQFNELIEEDLRFGKGKAYGLELLIKKPGGRLNGWISYEYSVSKMKIKDIQEKDWFFSPYDSPHDFTIVGIYNLSKKIDISATWLWKKGQPFNAPAMRYEYGNLIFPYYPGRNQDRLPDMHRLDFSLTIHNILIKNPKRSDELVLSVYNAYNYKTPDIIYFKQNVTDYYKTDAVQVTYIPFFPSITYNFKF